MKRGRMKLVNYKLKVEDDIIIEKIAKYYGVNKVDAIRIAIYKEARNLGLIKDEEVSRK